MRSHKDYRLKKIERLAKGSKPRVVDLFSGCGGMTLGFHAAGFEIIGNIEIDEWAAKTHTLNFHSSVSKERQELFSKARDITKLDPKHFIQEIYQDVNPKEQVDIVIGGPPCQAFARVGRAKLREIAKQEDAYINDDRASLYLHYLRYVREYQPLAVVMENVPDILNFGGTNIAQEICETLEELGYVCSYTLLNSVFYGVPQMRERFFLIAVAKELAAIPSFPQPTHWIELPPGYENARKVALKNIYNQSLFDSNVNFIEPPLATPGLMKAVSAKEALGDLPPITMHLEGNLSRGAKRLNEVTPYCNINELSEYSRTMRQWPNFENTIGITGHVIRNLPRDYAIFSRMQPGDQYPEAYNIAKEIFYERLHLLEKSGVIVGEGTHEYNELWAAIVPPYDPGKFPNKWRKMESELPARTLMAHLGKDSYSHIHYDSNQARTISVREAARLQSFPDGFQFVGTMNPGFKQIGNAVPPLLAKSVANTLLFTLHSALSKGN